MDRPLRILAMAGSNRRGSLNRHLLDRVAEVLGARPGVEVEVFDLRRHPLPLYDADLQGRDGIPAGAEALHDAIAAADAVVFANPEYNGGYPALFKNAVDWVSRVDMFVLHPRYVGLVSATPGKGGGARGMAHARALLGNMFVTVHEDAFALPAANVALAEDGSWADPAEADRLDAWADAYLDGARAHVEAREDEAAA